MKKLEEAAQAQLGVLETLPMLNTEGQQYGTFYRKSDRTIVEQHHYDAWGYGLNDGGLWNQVWFLDDKEFGQTAIDQAAIGQDYHDDMDLPVKCDMCGGRIEGIPYWGNTCSSACEAELEWILDGWWTRRYSNGD